MKLSLNLMSPPCSVILPILIGSDGWPRRPPARSLALAGDHRLAAPGDDCGAASLANDLQQVQLALATDDHAGKEIASATSPIDTESGFRRRSSLPR
jgi:hypothetical protein